MTRSLQGGRAECVPVLCVRAASWSDPSSCHHTAAGAAGFTVAVPEWLEHHDAHNPLRHAAAGAWQALVLACWVTPPRKLAHMGLAYGMPVCLPPPQGGCVLSPQVI